MSPMMKIDSEAIEVSFSTLSGNGYLSKYRVSILQQSWYFWVMINLKS